MNIVMNKYLPNTIQVPEWAVDSRYHNADEEKREAKALLKARLQRLKNVSEQDKMKTKLLQIKWQMEDYVKCGQPNKEYGFAYFLATYLDTLYSKRIDFTNDLNVSAVLLSQVIGKHREPSLDFILKLMVHSKKVFSLLEPIDVSVWYRIYLLDKLHHTLANQAAWLKQYEKQVKVKAIV
jgi:hypothetical protein